MLYEIGKIYSDKRSGMWCTYVYVCFNSILTSILLQHRNGDIHVIRLPEMPLRNCFLPGQILYIKSIKNRGLLLRLASGQIRGKRSVNHLSSFRMIPSRNQLVIWGNVGFPT
jgi:hypothetical protein